MLRGRTPPERMGCVAGAISVVGYVYIQPYFNRKADLMDSCCAMNLHGMTGLIGARSGAISAAVAENEQYGQNIAAVCFPRAPQTVWGGPRASRPPTRSTRSSSPSLILAPASDESPGTVEEASDNQV